MRVHPTVTASTMITQICSLHKVRCHMGAVERFGAGEAPSRSRRVHENQNPGASAAWTNPPQAFNRKGR